MSFYRKYELLEVLRDDGVKTFQGREMATGKPVQVHLLLGQPNISAPPLELLDAVNRLSPNAKADVLEMGEYSGTPYIVTNPLQGYAGGFREWVSSNSEGGGAPGSGDALSRVGRWQIPPGGSAPAPPPRTSHVPPVQKVSGTTGAFSVGGGGSSGLTQMFQRPASAPQPVAPPSQPLSDATQMFPAQSPQVTPQAPPKDLGLTQMLGGPAGGTPTGAVPQWPAGSVPDAGNIPPRQDFGLTQMLGGGGAPPPQPTAQHPVASSPMPSATPPKQDFGLTQMLGSGGAPPPRPTAQHPVASSPPAAPPKQDFGLTQMFGGGAPPSQPTAQHPVASSPMPPATPPRQDFGLTQMLGSGGAPPPQPTAQHPVASSPLPPATPPKQDFGLTQMIGGGGAPAPQPTAQHPVASSPLPPPAPPKQDFGLTQMFGGGGAPPPQPTAQHPVASSPLPPPAPPKQDFGLTQMLGSGGASPQPTGRHGVPQGGGSPFPPAAPPKQDFGLTQMLGSGGAPPPQHGIPGGASPGPPKQDLGLTHMIGGGAPPIHPPAGGGYRPQGPEAGLTQVFGGKGQSSAPPGKQDLGLTSILGGPPGGQPKTPSSPYPAGQGFGSQPPLAGPPSGGPPLSSKPGGPPSWGPPAPSSSDPGAYTQQFGPTSPPHGGTQPPAGSLPQQGGFPGGGYPGFSPPKPPVPIAQPDNQLPGNPLGKDNSPYGQYVNLPQSEMQFGAVPKLNIPTSDKKDKDNAYENVFGPGTKPNYDVNQQQPAGAPLAFGTATSSFQVPGTAGTGQSGGGSQAPPPNVGNFSYTQVIQTPKLDGQEEGKPQQPSYPVPSPPGAKKMNWIPFVAFGVLFILLVIVALIVFLKN